MSQIDFDDFVDEYDDLIKKQTRFFDSQDYFAEYKVTKAKSLLTQSPNTILDFGCGISRSTYFLKKQFPAASIHGCDISAESILKAKKRFPDCHFSHVNDLLVSKEQFDLIFIANVFHHIPPKDRPAAMQEIIRLCAKKAKIILFEHNPLNPVTRHLVNTCPFDRDAVLLKPKEMIALFSAVGLCHIKYHYTLFFPGFLKQLRFLENYLKSIPLGGQYMIYAEYNK